MQERKPIGITVPYRDPNKTREQLERRVEELEAVVKQLEKSVRALDRALLTGKK
jgi:exonuclease VII small subunit